MPPPRLRKLRLPNNLAGDVLLAAVMGAQGLKGEVKVKTFTAAPEALRASGVLHDAKGKTYKITAFRPTKPGEAVIAFAGVTDRNTAEALRGTELFVTRAALPAPAADEFYHADLIGLEAFDTGSHLRDFFMNAWRNSFFHSFRI